MSTLFRFMPEGMYLDARVLGPAKTAKKISKYIRNRKLYYNFFRFRRYYTFDYAHHNPATDPVCILCAMLNDKRRRDERRVYAYFTQWWNGIKPGENPEDPIIYYSRKNHSLVNERPKIKLESPNRFALNVTLPEDKDGPFLVKVFDHYFGS